MKVLLVYPEFTDSFWSFKHALKLVGKKASMPPVGLLTVAGLLPDDWEKKLIDMNVENLDHSWLAWADMVMISAMNAQTASAQALIEELQDSGVTIVAGGPLFSNDPESWEGTVKHVFAGEAENTLPDFLKDLKIGAGKSVYKSREYPSLAKTPVPSWNLINMSRYNTMGIQFSRGCPHNCDFCNITSLFGRAVRTKSTSQVIAELDSIHRMGWKAGVFFVDDNFIGNRRYLKSSLLPELIAWRSRHRKITFQTETSILLADDDELMDLMVRAGFNTVFIGIETADDESLLACGKTQNTGRDLISDVRRIQHRGLEVEAGFIVGFDSDRISVFKRQFDFIQKSGIVTAMVALLQAPKGTRLYRRLSEEGRISGEVTDGTDGTTNIIPFMGRRALASGYRQLISQLYSPKAFYSRLKLFLKEYRPAGNLSREFSFNYSMALPRSIVRLGLLGRERFEYWKLLIWTLFRHPKLIPLALRLAIYGYHFSRTIAVKP